MSNLGSEIAISAENKLIMHCNLSIAYIHHSTNEVLIAAYQTKDKWIMDCEPYSKTNYTSTNKNDFAHAAWQHDSIIFHSQTKSYNIQFIQSSRALLVAVRGVNAHGS